MKTKQNWTPLKFPTICTKISDKINVLLNYVNALLELAKFYLFKLTTFNNDLLGDGLAKKWAWFEQKVGVVRKFLLAIYIYDPLNLQLVPTPMRNWIEGHSYRCFHGCHPLYLSTFSIPLLTNTV